MSDPQIDSRHVIRASELVTLADAIKVADKYDWLSLSTSLHRAHNRLKSLPLPPKGPND